MLQACGAELKHIETFHGGTHNDTWTRYGYYEQVKNFIGYVREFDHNNVMITYSLLLLFFYFLF